MRLFGCLAIAALALAGCNQRQAGAQAPNTQSPAANPATALPEDAVLALALLKDHVRNCQKAMVYNRSSVGFMPGSAPLPQVESERAGFVEVFGKEPNVQIGETIVQYAVVSTGEPTNFTMQYAVGSAQNPYVTDPLDFAIQKQVTQEGAVLSLSYAFSVCPVTAREVSIVDHEFDPNSDKNATIRYQVTYGASNALTLLAALGSRTPPINPALADVALRYGAVPPPRSGIATLHRNDATGWKIESERLQ